jgi:predicted nucleotidyltransferase
MIAIGQIEELTRRIVEEFRPQRVLLFGSYARGTPNADSDVDLLVVLPQATNPHEASVQIRLRTRPTFPVDLLVRTPEKIRQRIKMGDTFMKDIMENGRVLYEADVA